ncbi:MAG: GTP pyrophosphokinase family protein [Terrisporobacter sp.]|uniref:GTP pyrophosphokinase n=1 Tax=Terrisporobacter sp. TaxID=1965305 RepID=UPI002FCBBEAC
MIKEQLKDQFIKGLIDDYVIELFQRNMMPVNELMSYYRCAIMEVETKFKVLNEQFSLQYDRNPIETIKSRLKSPEGIAKKLKRKNLEFSIRSIEENLNDVAGVRVICSFTEDIYLLAECLLQQDDIKLIEIKDYIKNPKESGYRSLHLIVEVPIFLENEKKNRKVEVQLRTIAMDFWASLEHKLRYKKDIPQEELDRLAEELVECAQVSAALDERMEQIRNRMSRI